MDQFFNDPFPMFHIKMCMMGEVKMDLQGDGWLLEKKIIFLNNMKRTPIAKSIFIPIELFLLSWFHNQFELNIGI